MIVFIRGEIFQEDAKRYNSKFYTQKASKPPYMYISPRSERFFCENKSLSPLCRLLSFLFSVKVFFSDIYFDKQSKFLTLILLISDLEEKNLIRATNDGASRHFEDEAFLEKS